MKYSLRSLMRFSIRDLFWITIVVALAVAWWVERSRLADKEIEFMRLNIKLMREQSGERLLRERLEAVEQRLIKELDSPTSQAPAPNPLKP